MARMHSRKKGKSGSKKPIENVKKSWIRYSNKEIEALIVKLSKQGESASKIGLILRDSYGVPSVREVLNKKVVKVLIDNKREQELPEDLIALIKKDIKLIKHLETNKKDMGAKRGSQLTESKIRRLSNYYKKNGKINKDWKYDRESAKLLVS